MKKLIFTLLALTGACLGMNAQISVVDGSFRSLNESNREASGSDIGSQNMTSRTITWPTNADGDDVNALLVVSFENMAPDDIKEVTARLSNGIVSLTETREQNGMLNRWFFIPASSEAFDVTFIHPRFGQTRLSGVTMDRHEIYLCRVRNAATTNVIIDSDPKNSDVYFDEALVGATPITLSDVKMGPHSIEIKCKDPRMATNIARTIVDVSAGKANFYYDMRKRKDVKINVEPKSSDVTVTRNGQQVARGTGSVMLTDAYYGDYKVTGRNGIHTTEEVITVNDNSPMVETLKVVPTRSVNFIAYQNNENVSGAEVVLDNRTIGQTPLTKTLPYGTYRVEYLYNGYKKDKKFKVNNNSDADVKIKLPNRRSHRYNPFDIDYTTREWGFAINYINRGYSAHVGDYSEKYNMWGLEGSDHGVQVGLIYQPYFGYGQGLSTGVYYQGFFGSVDEIEGVDKFSFEDHQIYIPLQYQFRLPLAEEFSIFVNAGIGMSFGIEHKIHFDGDSDTNKTDIGYGEDYGMPNAFNWGLLYGGGVQFKAFQIEAKFSRGFNHNEHMFDYSGSEDFSVKQNTWSIGLSMLF